MPKGTRIDDVTLEQALEMFKLPRTLGTDDDGVEILANVGRFGPYVQKGKLYASIPKDKDVFTISLKSALKLLRQRQEQAQKSLIAEFEGGLKVRQGRFGPYVTNGKINAKVPKDLDPKKLTKVQAAELIKKKAQA